MARIAPFALFYSYLIIALLILGGLVPARAQSLAFVETFDGSPSAAGPFASPRWHVFVHERDRDRNGPGTLVPYEAHHGPSCEAPLAHHPVSVYDGTTFLCGSGANSHLMTTMNGTSYGAVVLTPHAMLDWSAGPATIEFDVSTLVTSAARDWWSVDIAPYEDGLFYPTAEFAADAYHQSRRSVSIVEGNRALRGTICRDWVCAAAPGPFAYGWDRIPGFTESAAVRSHFRITLSSTSIQACIIGVGSPVIDRCWVNGAIADLGWTRGTVRLNHWSYTPEKGCTKTYLPDGSRDISQCHPNTWHWDNIALSSTAPIQIIPSVPAQAWVKNPSPALVTFAAPAPANAELRFIGHGLNGSVEVSFDDGATWQPVLREATTAKALGWLNVNHSVRMPMPAGAQSVMVRATRDGSGWSYFEGFSIWTSLGNAPPYAP